MEIEIVTTKKKLTKSLMSQMPIVNKIETMRDAEVLGYIQVDKVGKVAVLRHAGEYYTRTLHWVKYGEKNVSRNNSSMAFESTEVRDKWLEAHDRVQEIALKTHIYI